MNKQELQSIKKKALTDHIPIIMDDTLAEIAGILKELQPKKILEIGTAVGYSAICFSEYITPDGKIDTIEKDEERAQQAIENFSLVQVEDKIQIWIGDAMEILPTLENEYDAIFIDAAKSKYPFFLQQALRMLKHGGVIIADNVLYKGYVLGDYNKHKQRTAVRNLREFLQELQDNQNLEVRILEVGDGLAIAKKIH